MKIKVGQHASRSVELTEAAVDAFAALTGDYNPLHFDEGYAAKTRFGRRVVHGGLTTGVLHGLIAQELPGPGSIFMSQSFKFVAPVFIGDRISASAEVASVHASKPVVQLALKVSRSDGEVVLEGEAWVYVLDVEAEENYNTAD